MKKTLNLTLVFVSTLSLFLGMRVKAGEYSDGNLPDLDRVGESGDLGTLNETAILDYTGSGSSPGDEDHGPCTYDIAGEAHIVVDGDADCSEDFSLYLYLNVITYYIFTVTYLEEGNTDKIPNIDEYEDDFTLNAQNDYVWEGEKTWEEGNVYGTQYFRAELLSM